MSQIIKNVSRVAAKYDVTLPADLVAKIDRANSIRIPAPRLMDTVRDVAGHLGDDEKTWEKAIQEGLLEITTADNAARYGKVLRDESLKIVEAEIAARRDEIAGLFADVVEDHIATLNATARKVPRHLTRDRVADLDEDALLAWKAAEKAWTGVLEVSQALLPLYPASGVLPRVASALVVVEVPDFDNLAEAKTFLDGLQGKRLTNPQANAMGAPTVGEGFAPALIAHASAFDEPFGFAVPGEYAQRRIALEDSLKAATYMQTDDTDDAPRRGGIVLV